MLAGNIPTSPALFERTAMVGCEAAIYQQGSTVGRGVHASRHHAGHAETYSGEVTAQAPFVFPIEYWLVNQFLFQRVEDDPLLGILRGNLDKAIAHPGDSYRIVEEDCARGPG